MLKKILKISIYASVVTLVAVSTFGVYAAFIAPSDTPSTSTQDWPANAVGANNANNAFSSASVAGNLDGSLLERAEDLRQTLAQNGYDSSFATANANGSVLQILKDIRANAASTAYITLSASPVCSCHPTNGPTCYTAQPTCPTGWTQSAAWNVPGSFIISGYQCYQSVTANWNYTLCHN